MEFVNKIMKNLRVEYWFPTPIWIADLDINNDPIKTTCLKLREGNPEGRSLSNLGGWQSNDLYVEHNITVFSEFILEITKILNEILHFDYEQTDRCVVISHFWININNENNINQVHIHPGSFLSGVYYVSSPSGSGNINFQRNSMESYALGSMKLIGKNTVSTISCEYPPVESRLLVFPGWIPHSVSSNTECGDRISIAFNSEIRTSTFGGLL